jgi:hypothetical protein
MAMDDGLPTNHTAMSAQWHERAEVDAKRKDCEKKQGLGSWSTLRRGTEHRDDEMR